MTWPKLSERLGEYRRSLLSDGVSCETADQIVADLAARIHASLDPAELLASEVFDIRLDDAQVADALRRSLAGAATPFDAEAIRRKLLGEQ